MSQARRVLALTATATKPTVSSVCEILKLETIVRADRSFALEELLAEESQIRIQRPNLTMDVRQVADMDLQLREAIRILRNEVDPKDSVVIYVWRRATADQLAKQLRPYVKGNISAYHSSMLPEARTAVQSNFMSGKIKVVVATVAFGMGLDKPDIRMVIHFGIPKSIETLDQNYIQETGRCARDGASGKCVALVSPKDYQMMRWLESGGGGGGTKTPLVRKLLMALLGDSKEYPRHILSKNAFLLAGGREEDLQAEEMNCSLDELHSILAHWCRYAAGYVSLLSSFPTKLKLRHFGGKEPVDPLLRQVLPLTKKVGPVYSLDTAKALATMGGTAGQLSNGLWQARGDEFSVEKADFGYLVSVVRPISQAQMEDWASQISSINVRARETAVEKLDCAFLALTKAAEARERQQVSDPESQHSASDETLNGLIDAYFAATSEPSSVVAGGGLEMRKRLEAALGAQYTVSTQARPLHQSPPAAATGSGKPKAAPPAAGLVRLTVARLLMDPAWPDLACDEMEAIVHAVAQFLAGVGSVVLPAKKWSQHQFWGRFRNLGDFQTMEES
eukprot:g11820.t1